MTAENRKGDSQRSSQPIRRRIAPWIEVSESNRGWDESLEILHGEFFNAMPVAVYTTDADGLITRHNEAAAALWGRPPKKGERWCGIRHLYGPDGDPIDLEESPMATALLEDRSVHGAEAIAERDDGSRFPFLAFTTPFRDEAGEPTGAVTAMVEVAEMKRKGPSPSDGAILEAALDGIVMIDHNGRVTEFNPAAEEIFGYSRSDVLGREMADLIVPPDQRERHRRGLARFVETGEGTIIGRRIEVAAMRSDGSEFPAELSISVVRGGEKPAFAAYLRDITDRRRAEAALRDSEERFRDLIENAHDLIQSVRPDGSILYVNRTWRETLGYSAEEAADLSLMDIVDPGCLEHCFDLFKKVMEGEDVGRIETTFRARNGQLVHVEGGSNCRIVDGKPVATRSIFRDVTDRKRAEQRVRWLNRTYSVLSGINQLIVRERSSEKLFSEACRIAVEHGGFHLAWVGLTSDEPGGRKRIIAQAGATEDMIESIESIINGHLTGQPCSFTERALSTGAQAVCNDLETDPEAAAWRDVALHLESRSLASLPLTLRGAVIGTLNLHACEPEFFDAEETRLLDELASDISFALEVSRRDSELVASAVRQSRQRSALISLTERRRAGDEDVDAALRRITETATQTLEVARAGIWRFDLERSAIECVDLFQSKLGRHNRGEILQTKRYPAYFRALSEQEFIAAADAVGDSRTREFADDHFHPLEIGARLDVPIRIGGIRAGVLTLEHVGGPRNWEEDEQSFALALANLASLALERGVRLQAEANLRASEKRFRQLAETIEEVFWITNPEGTEMIYVSPAFETIWRRTCASLRDQPGLWLESVHPDDRDRVAQAIRAKRHVGGYEEIYRIQRPDGTDRWIRERAYPVRGPAGTIVRIVGTAEDVTERKKIEEQLLRNQRMESIGTLAGGIAHDLNNVLAPIMMAIELLKMGESDPETLEVLSTIETSTKRGASMVKQILSFARGAEGHRSDVQVGYLLREMEKIINETFPKNIRACSDIPEDLWIVQGDPTQIHQIFLNLCVNARDAMPDGGIISISARNEILGSPIDDADPGPQVVIEVEDNGAGIAPGVLERIFEPFYTTKELGKGTGLGLSTTLAIVKSHGGFVRVNSEVGKGTKFIIGLPTPQSLEWGEESPAPVEISRGEGELVLVVDDEAVIRQITRQTLEAFGYRVAEASSGEEAVAVYRSQGSDIAAVVTDMMMPEMSGEETIRALREIDPEARIIASSGLETDEMMDTVSGTGVSQFLLKPYTAEALLAALREVIGK